MRHVHPIAETGFFAWLFASALLFGAVALAADPPEAARADEQIVEFTDDTRIHGRILKLGSDELLLQRTDFTEPLVFSLREIRRITLRGPLSKAELKDSKTNATMHFQGGDWIAGDVATFENGRFQMRIGKLTDVAIDREKVQWLFLSPTQSPAVCAGPGSELGLAGWEGGYSWEFAPSGLVAHGQPGTLRQVLDLPVKVDIEFTSENDVHGNAVPIAFILGDGDDSRDDNFAGGFIQVMLQSNHVSASALAGQGTPFKNFETAIPVAKNAPRQTRYRILHDRRTGRIVVLVNGKKVADWDGQWKRNPSGTSKVILQPNVGPGTPWPRQNMRLSPWDGNIEPDAKPDEAGRDLLSSEAPGHSAGSLDAVNAEVVHFGGKEFARKDPLFIRLAGKNPAGPQPRAIARLRLTQRGEFDASALDFRDGHFHVRTSFCGEIALPLAAIRSIEFPHGGTAAEAGAPADRLVFKNGDVLRGTLIGTKATSVGWRPARGVALEPGIATLAGIVLGRPPASKTGTAGSVLRLRNGDWFRGDLGRLDAAQLQFKSTTVGLLQIPKANLNALYFSDGSGSPVFDASADRNIWIRNAIVGGEPGQSHCRYLDGTFFSYSDPQNQTSPTDFANLGRSFTRLPDKVEFSFTVSDSHGGEGLAFSMQLFVDPARGGGILIDFGGNQVTIQDMSQEPGRMQPQALTVELESADAGSARHFRFLADRRTGQIAMFMNGKLVASHSPRAGKAAPKRGRHIFLFPQMPSMTVSNLWVAPWTGSLPKMPGNAKPAEPVQPRPEVIALVNGDETPGIIESTTGKEIRVHYEGGDVEIPSNRALMIGFAGLPVAPVPGTRLRLTGGGVLTVQSFTLTGGTVSCRSALLGDVTFPVSALSEIAWQRPGQKASAGVPAADAKPADSHDPPPLEQARFNAAALEAMPARSYDVLEAINNQESVIGRFEMKTTAGRDSVTLDDEFTITKANASSLTRRTVTERNATLRVKEITGVSVRGTTRRLQSLTIASGKATLQAAGATKSPDQVFDYPPNTVTLFSLMRIVTALPTDAEGEWAIESLFNDFRLRPQADGKFRLDCAGPESLERDNRTLAVTRFTLRHDQNADAVVAEFFLDDSGVLQQADFFENASPRGMPLSLRLRPAE